MDLFLFLPSHPLPFPFHPLPPPALRLLSRLPFAFLARLPLLAAPTCSAVNDGGIELPAPSLRAVLCSGSGILGVLAAAVM